MFNDVCQKQHNSHILVQRVDKEKKKSAKLNEHELPNMWYPENKKRIKWSQKWRVRASHFHSHWHNRIITTYKRTKWWTSIKKIRKLWSDWGREWLWQQWQLGEERKEENKDKAVEGSLYIMHKYTLNRTFFSGMFFILFWAAATPQWHIL